MKTGVNICSISINTSQELMTSKMALMKIRINVSQNIDPWDTLSLMKATNLNKYIKQR